MTTHQDERPGEGLAIFGYADPGGGFRARVRNISDLEDTFDTGLPWTPGNMSINVFGAIPADSPYGSLGDARLRPDPSVQVSLGPESNDILVLCDATQLDGSPWMHCPRTILKDALNKLHAATGLRVKASFEHEFAIVNWKGGAQKPISYESIRQIKDEVTQTLSRLKHAGVRPEIWFPEFGLNQHECTIAPAIGVTAADNTVIFREIVRESMASFGHEITFSPVTTPDGVGNGVHIHLSLIDDADQPVMYDPNGPSNLSDIGHRFATGIVKHMPALTALTAPSVISGLRMQPGKWSASHTVLSLQDRAAALRICPLTTEDDASRSRAFNIEYRATDATANPYLALASLVYAGVASIEASYEKVVVLEEDFTSHSDSALEELGIRMLPQSLESSLEALEADPVVLGWFDEGFLTNFRSIKRSEIDAFGGMTPRERCDFYSATI